MMSRSGASHLQESKRFCAMRTYTEKKKWEAVDYNEVQFTVSVTNDYKISIFPDTKVVNDIRTPEDPREFIEEISRQIQFFEREKRYEVTLYITQFLHINQHLSFFNFNTICSFTNFEDEDGRCNCGDENQHSWHTLRVHVPNKSIVYFFPTKYVSFNIVTNDPGFFLIAFTPTIVKKESDRRLVK